MAIEEDARRICVGDGVCANLGQDMGPDENAAETAYIVVCQYRIGDEKGKEKEKGC